MNQDLHFHSRLSIEGGVELQTEHPDVAEGGPQQEAQHQHEYHQGGRRVLETSLQHTM